ncbi:MAG TPA: hypothetical protein VEK07_04465 [Polyangiaceae bacterium]|nr:hypothetical protein [Polyangiaceae bacterium]
MVRAANVCAALDAFSFAPSIARRVIASRKLRLDDLTPDKFVPVQAWLDALEDIQRTVGVSVVRAVGSRVIQNAQFPPQYATVESILESLDTIYHMSHRGEVGHYRSSGDRMRSSYGARLRTPNTSSGACWKGFVDTSRSWMSLRRVLRTRPGGRRADLHADGDGRNDDAGPAALNDRAPRLPSNETFAHDASRKLRFEPALPETPEQ